MLLGRPCSLSQGAISLCKSVTEGKPDLPLLGGGLVLWREERGDQQDRAVWADAGGGSWPSSNIRSPNSARPASQPRPCLRLCKRRGSAQHVTRSLHPKCSTWSRSTAPWGPCWEPRLAMRVRCRPAGAHQRGNCRAVPPPPPPPLSPPARRLVPAMLPRSWRGAGVSGVHHRAGCGRRSHHAGRWLLGSG